MFQLDQAELKAELMKFGAHEEEADVMVVAINKGLSINEDWVKLTATEYINRTGLALEVFDTPYVFYTKAGFKIQTLKSPSGKPVYLIWRSTNGVMPLKGWFRRVAYQVSYVLPSFNTDQRTLLFNLLNTMVTTQSERNRAKERTPLISRQFREDIDNSWA